MGTLEYEKLTGRDATGLPKMKDTHSEVNKPFSADSFNLSSQKYLQKKLVSLIGSLAELQNTFIAISQVIST